MEEKIQKSKPVVKGNRGVKVIEACTIRRTPEELYQYWRRFENLPKFMKHLEAVSQGTGQNSHWVAKAPGGRTVEWDAVIINEHPGSLIAWRTTEGAEVAHAGSVRFERSAIPDHTEVTVQVEYDSPGGKFGKFLAKLFGEEPGQQIAEDLGRFKALMETGEIATTEGQSSGRSNKEEQREAA
jgi:uncharacterized membrane protein